MDWKLEVIVLPVSDVDRAKEFYGDRLGFRLDVDHAPNEQFRVVQLTPPGSACSITFGLARGRLVRRVMERRSEARRRAQSPVDPSCGQMVVRGRVRCR